MKVYNESGKGYWMEGFGCIRAEGENRPSRPGHVVVGCDMYNFQITGDVSCNLNASSCNSPTHSGPTLLILNDQGGDVMNVANDVASTLRAQDHGHPPVVCMAFDVYNMQGNKDVFKTLNSGATDSDHIPVVCFEPGILSRDCSAGNRAYVDICSTLRAQMGDNQPAVVYPINLMVATRCERDDMRTCFGVGEPGDPQFTLSSAHEHAVCYSVDSHPMDSRFRIDGDVSGTVTTKLAKGSADGPLVIVENE